MWKNTIKKEDIFDNDALIEKIHNTIQETVRDAKNLDSQYGDYHNADNGRLEKMISLLSEAHEIARKMLKETR
mgnify:CR=1 FL=1|tara:strand:- start:2473 stop:2691 length:219 start_codon:yes stop_codon:yes gene_type:complete